MTAEKFVPNPYSEEGGERLYRTGDLARWKGDGTVEFLGRLDHQVKVRGYRIELGEIEAVLEEHEEVEQAVVVAREEGGGEKRLVAYVVGKKGKVESGALRMHVKSKLPEYMVPGVVVEMKEMPLTANGKVNRAALPAPERGGRGRGEEGYVGPRTAVEEVLAGIWAEVLRMERVGVEENFFELGGHSLLATQVMSRIRREWGVELPLRSLFEEQTIAGLGREIEKRMGEQGGVPVRRIERVGRGGDLPMSFGQQRLWFLEQLEPGNSAYHIGAAVRLSGELNVEALERTLSEIVRRHETLRTVFPSVEGRGVQRVVEPWAVRLERREIEEGQQLGELLEREAEARFDLETGRLLRGVLVRVGEREHVMQLTMHHMVSDGWSMGVLVKEMGALYPVYAEGGESGLEELKIQYGDYAVWQRRRMEEGKLERQLEYWRKQLAGVEVLQLSGERRRGAVLEHEGGERKCVLEAGLVEELKGLGRRENVTLFMTLLGAWQILLWRHSGQKDIAVGTPIANRNREEVEGLIGFFVNTVVMRGRMGSEMRVMRVKEVLKQAREEALGAYAHQDVPFEKVVEELQPERDLGQTPLFQAMLVLQNAPQGEMEIGGVKLRREEWERKRVQFDLTLEGEERGDDLVLGIKYRSQQLDGARVERMLEHYQELLKGMVRNVEARIGELGILGEGEKRQVVEEWNRTRKEYGRGESLHGMIEEQVRRRPEAVAVEYEQERMSYGELNEAANRLARRLRRMGVGREVLVGICMDRSVEMVVGLLGILKAGGAYVPLDPEYPKERLGYMLEDSGAPVLVTQSWLLEKLPEHGARVVCLDGEGWEEAEERGEWGEKKEGERGSEEEVGGKSLAYVIYTSGSTGRPKGAMNTHEGICNRLQWMQEEYGLREEDRVLQKTPSSFDVSVWEYFWPLMSGSVVVMARPGGHRDSQYLSEVIEEKKVTTLHFVPSMMQAFLQDGELERCGTVRQVMSSGEALSAELQERFLGRMKGKLHNLYGPTEAAVDVTYWECKGGREGRSVPIGRPIANMQVYVLDEEMNAVPIGVAGELYLGGIGLGRGYWGRAEMTAEKFVPNPYSEEGGERLYRTGDLGRWTEEGVVEFLGRRDYQVKVRGFRIELGEIEAVVEQHEEVEQAVVMAREERAGDKQLVAYVVRKRKGEGESEEEGEKRGEFKGELRRYVKSKLPEYMVPGAIVELEGMPLTANGKVDRGALPAPERVREDGEVGYVGPRTPGEEVLAGIWAEVLGLTRVGVHDNFFEIGGDSILSIQVVAKAKKQGLLLRAQQMFEEQTIAGLSTLVGRANMVPAEQGPVTGDVPLTPIQEWFFAQNLEDGHHFNQSVLLRLKQELDIESVKKAVQGLLQQHDALRTRYRREDGQWRQEILADENAERIVYRVDLRNHGEEREAVQRETGKWQRSLNLESGPLMRVVLIDLREGQRLLVIVHHLVVDGVSWRILLEDFEKAYWQAARGRRLGLGLKTASFKHWAEQLNDLASDEKLAREAAYWKKVVCSRADNLPVDGTREENLEEHAETVTVRLNEEQTSSLLHEIPAAYQTQINEILLTAFLRGMAEAAGTTALLLDLEGHGREDLGNGMDVTRTIGWFTSLYPVRLEWMAGETWGETLMRLKQQLRSIPRRGVGYGLLKYGRQKESYLVDGVNAEIIFNYLGQMDHVFAGSELLQGAAPEPCASPRSGRDRRSHLLQIDGGVLDGCLFLAWRYGSRIHRRERVEAWSQAVQDGLLSLIEHCRTAAPAVHTASDFTEIDLDEEDFNMIMSRVKGSLV
jgi:amino acid adenylation domain-containing protein/non-ribosomal peptide synthase protein (TIGR01720 family)